MTDLRDIARWKCLVTIAQGTQRRRDDHHTNYLDTHGYIQQTPDGWACTRKGARFLAQHCAKYPTKNDWEHE